MAFKIRHKTNSSIKAFYTRARLLAAQGVPTSLKVTMMGRGMRGGWVTRWEKLRRKMPKQMKNTSSTRRIREIPE